jgi:heme o synthase
LSTAATGKPLVGTEAASSGARDAAPQLLARPGVVASLIETTKPSITRLVTITSMVGFAMAALPRTWRLEELALAALSCAVGTALSAAGANSVNQYIERHRDALMPRTMRRPLPQKRVEPGAVLWTGLGLAGLGVLVLALGGGLAPACMALLCFLSYIVVYTPMKPMTPWATIVGTIPGALPTLIGWTAGSPGRGWESALDPGGLSLVALMTVWQVPHFLAIAWMYKDDYALGGYRVLPVVDPSGRRTSIWIVGWTMLLLPATLAPLWAMGGIGDGLHGARLGLVYGAVAVATWIGYAWLGVKLLRQRDRAAARSVFFASIAHLPLLLVVMVGDAVVRRFLM